MRSFALRIAVFGSILLATNPAHAGHFRFGNLSWKPISGGSATDAEIVFIAVFQLSAFPVPPTTVGDIVTEDIGFTELLFGDGVRTGALDFEVTTINLGGDWFMAKAVIALPGTKTGTVNESSDDNDTPSEVDTCGSPCEIDVGESFAGDLSPFTFSGSPTTFNESENNDTFGAADAVTLDAAYQGVIEPTVLDPVASIIDESESNDTNATADMISVNDDFDGALSLSLDSSSPSTTNESEPNNTSGTPDPLTIGNDYDGSLSDPSDVDYISFTMSGPDIVAATLHLGTLDNASLQLLDSDGTTILAGAGTSPSPTALPSSVVFAFQDAGTYYLSVSSPGHCCSGSYDLELRRVAAGPMKASVAESESNDTSATADDVVFGDDFDGEIVAGARGPFSGVTHDESGSGLEPNDTFGTASAIDMGDDFDGDVNAPMIGAMASTVAESESNNSSGSADAISVGDDFTGTITGACNLDSTACTADGDCSDGTCSTGTCTNVAVGCSVDGDCDQSCASAGDADYASFSVSAGDTISATLTLGSLSSGTLTLYDTDGSTSLISSGSSFLYEFTSGGTYFLAVSSGNLGTYTVNLREAVQDLDYMSFSAVEGKIVTAKVVPGTLSGDATVKLYDSSMAQVRTDTGSSPETAPYTIPSTGTYFLSVNSSSSGSCCNTGSYTLELRTAGDTDIVSLNIAGNETLSATLAFSTVANGRVRLLEPDGETPITTVSGGSSNQRIVHTFNSTCSISGDACVQNDDCGLGQTCDSAAGTYYLEVTTPDACCSGTYTLGVRLEPDVVDIAKFSLTGATSVFVGMDLSLPDRGTGATTNEVESNDTPGTTTDTMAVGDDYAGALGSDSDVDVVSFTGTAGQTIFVRVNLDPTDADNAIDSGVLRVLDASETQQLTLFGSDEQPFDAILELPSTGTYYLEFTSQALPGCCTAPYTIELRNVGEQLDSWYIDLLDTDGVTVLDTAEGQGTTQNAIVIPGLAASSPDFYYLRVRTRAPSSNRGFGPYTLRLREFTANDPADFVSFSASVGDKIHAVVKPRNVPKECEFSGNSCSSAGDCTTGTCPISGFCSNDGSVSCTTDSDCSEACVSPFPPLDGDWQLQLLASDGSTVLETGQGGDLTDDPVAFVITTAGTHYLKVTSDVGGGAYTLNVREYVDEADNVDVVKFVTGATTSIKSRVVVGFNPGELSQSRLRLLDSGGSELSSALFFTNTAVPLQETLSAGTYYLEVTSTTGATGTYTLELLPALALGPMTHDYPAAGPFLAEVTGCCRVDQDDMLQNCPQCDYRLLTNIRFDIANASPVSSIPPIITAPDGDPGFSFYVPAVDPDGDAIRWRFSNGDESSITEVIGDLAGIAAPTINPTTGQVSWDTTGTSPGELYVMQVTVEETRDIGALKECELSGGVCATSVDCPGGEACIVPPIGKSTVDFLIQIVAGGANDAPMCSTSDGSAIKVDEQGTVSFTVSGTDPNGDSMTLDASGLPPGATMSPTLPVSGTSVSSDFSWTPDIGDAGVYQTTFIVTDDGGLQSVCIVTITVNSLCVVGGPYDTVCNSSSTSVMLDGSGTGSVYTNFLWTTDCANASFDDDTSATPTLTIDPVNPCAPPPACNVTLAVDDGGILSDSCTTTVTVCDTFCTDPCDDCDAGNTFCEHCPIDIVADGSIDQSDLDAAPNGTEYGAVSGCFGETCGTCPDCPAADPPPPASKVTIELVVQRTPAGSDVAATLPVSVNKVNNGDTYYLEVWAQTDKPEGLAQVTTDVGFSTGLTSAVGITHTSLFDQLTGGSIGAGVIDTLTGSVAGATPACSGAVGASPAWARVAIIELTADAVGTASFTSGSSGDAVSVNAVCGGFVVPGANYGSQSVEISVLGGDECTSPTAIGANATAMEFGHGGWFIFTAQSDATSIETCGSDFDTLIRIYSKCSGRYFDSNDDCNNGPNSGRRNVNASCFDPQVPSSEFASCLCLDTIPGTDYIIQVSQPDGSPPPDDSTTVLTLSKKDSCPSDCAQRVGACSKIDNSRNDLSPGCEDESCCETVCGLDDFCCNDTWDSLCVDLAIRHCDGIGACCHFDGKLCFEGSLEEECTLPGQVFHENMFCNEVTCFGIPTVSEWGLVIMTLLGCAIGTLLFRRGRRLEQMQ